jgi:hypothetical protein
MDGRPEVTQRRLAPLIDIFHNAFIMGATSVEGVAVPDDHFARSTSYTHITYGWQCFFFVGDALAHPAYMGRWMRLRAHWHCEHGGHDENGDERPHDGHHGFGVGCSGSSAFRSPGGCPSLSPSLQRTSVAGPSTSSCNSAILPAVTIAVRTKQLGDCPGACVLSFPQPSHFSLPLPSERHGVLNLTVRC